MQKSDWSCIWCTLVNKGHLTECAACGNFNSNYRTQLKTTETLSSLRSISRSKDHWDCTKCTFINNLSKQNCEICGSSKEEIQQGNETINNSNAFQTLNLERSTVGEIKDYCVSQGISFVDDSFPPAAKSLFLNGVSSSTTPICSKDIQWLRPSDIVHKSGNSSKEWKVTDNPSSSDTEQGYIGDCWFIAALTLIADNKELMHRILVTKEVNSEGIYVVRLFHDGVWKKVLIDDCFPCISNKLIYSRAKKQGLWVSLIEKAMAKLHGCYEALWGGSPSEGLTALTGYTTENVSWKEENFDFEVIWAQLLSSFMAGFIIGTSCGREYSKNGNGSRTKEYFENMGLQPNHCYSILEVVSADNVRMLKIRNPWGNFSWKGDWSDQSSLWTSHLRKLLSPARESEGTFWMCYDDFLNYFADIYICKLRIGWHEHNLDGIFLPNTDVSVYPAYSLEITKTTEIDATIYQYYSKNRNLKRDMTDLMLVLVEDKTSRHSPSAKSDVYLGKIVGASEHCVKCSVDLNCIAPPGKYFLVPLAFRHISKDLYPDFHIIIRSVQKISCKKCVMPNKGFIADTLMLLARKESIPEPMFENVLTYTFGSHGDSSIFVCDNRSINNIEITWQGETIAPVVVHPLSNSEDPGLFCTRGSNKVVDIIPPMRRQIIAMSFTSQSVSFKWEMTTHPKSTSHHQPEIGPEIEGLHMQRNICD